MKRLRIVAAAGLAGAVGTGALFVPAMASGTTTTHTLTFTAVQQRTANFSRTQFGEDDVAMRNGRIVGFAVIHGQLHPATQTARGRVAFATRGGFVYGVLRFSNGPVTRGRITGGTGKFTGATGTIVGKSLNKNGSRTAVTITYQN